MDRPDNYFLNVNWDDLDKNTHRVGFLSLYKEKFYFMIKGKENIPRAYNQGFNGIPGIKTDKIYVSKNEMFNILKKRLGIRETEKINIIQRILSEKIGDNSTLYNRRDRISFGQMNEREAEDCKKEIDTLEQAIKRNR